MGVSKIFLYLTGLALLIFGNRNFWNKYQAQKEKNQQKENLVHVNDDVVSRFETQKVHYDSIAGKWKNPHIYFQTVNVGNVNFEALHKGGTSKVDQNNVEKASSSQ